MLKVLLSASINVYNTWFLMRKINIKNSRLIYYLIIIMIYIMMKRDLKNRQSSENAAANRYIEKMSASFFFLIVLMILVFRSFALQLSGYVCGSLRAFSRLPERKHICGVIG